MRLSPPHRPCSFQPLTTMPLSWARATSPESTGAAFGVEAGTSARVSFQGPNTVAYEAIPSSDESETMLSNVLLRSAVRVLCREKEEWWLLQIVCILMMRGYTYVSSVFFMMQQYYLKLKHGTSGPRNYTELHVTQLNSPHYIQMFPLR